MMIVRCCKCNVSFEWTRLEQGIFQGLERSEQRHMISSAMCEVCGLGDAPKLTAAGALACHVVHISGKLSKNVSRETS